MADAEKDPSKLDCGLCCKSFFVYHWKGLFVVIIPLMLLPIMLLNQGNEFRCLYLICVMALFWISEVVPLYITSLIPIVALPLMGILDSETVCAQYYKETLVMFVGGLIVACSIEYSNLHKRLAMAIILKVGCSPRRLHCGLIFTSMFISMWISNSATTAMMCPIIRAILEQLAAQDMIKIYKEKDEDDKAEAGEGDVEPPSKIALGFYLGIAFAATTGGCATLIGTGTNLTFKGIYDARFPNSVEQISFPMFMFYAVPIVFLLTICLFLAIQITHFGLFRPNSTVGKEVAHAKQSEETAKKILKEKLKDLGPVSQQEIQVIILFFAMVILLFTRKPGFCPGWADLLNDKQMKNSAALIFIAILLFCFPVHYAFCRCFPGRPPYPVNEIPPVLSWKYVNKHVPWGLVFLLGGGFALSEGSTESGMAKMLGQALKGMKVLPPWVVQLLSVVVATFFTAFSANVPIANILIPVLNELAVAIEVHPLLLVMPAGLACSFAFLLPVSTPPNAIVAGYANIRTRDMAAAGALPTVISVLFLVINGLTWHKVVYPNSDEFPDWAKT